MVQSAVPTYEDEQVLASTSVPRFIQANGTAVTLTAGQQVLVQVTLQLINTVGSQSLAATIGRGGAEAPDTSYVNLANGVAFATTDMSVVSGVATVSNLGTTLAQTYYTTAERPALLVLSALDRPGAGSFYYAVRLTSSETERGRLNQFYVGNSYLTATVFGS